METAFNEGKNICPTYGVNVRKTGLAAVAIPYLHCFTIYVGVLFNSKAVVNVALECKITAFMAFIQYAIVLNS